MSEAKAPQTAAPTSPDPADVASAEKCVAEEMPKFWDYLERELGDSEYFVGGRLTIADIAIASPFVNLRHAGFAPERKRWPKLPDNVVPFAPVLPVLPVPPGVPACALPTVSIATEPAGIV